MTPPRAFHPPPIWDDHTLEAWRRQAIEDFIEERNAEGGEQYREAFAENVALAEALFAATKDLLDIGAGAVLCERPDLLRVARYLGAPPISADDLDTLADARIAGRRTLDVDLAQKAARIIESVLDRERFPWLFADPRRLPTPAERDIAIRWTAGLQTVQEVQTRRRSESAARQENVVETLLVSLGFAKIPTRPVDVTGGLAPREFCREALVAGSKCDIPIGLGDGRFLLLECKVSNSATNSVKRLNRETGGKAGRWRQAFGERAITGAVLAGVFKLRNLQDAQRAGVVIFWERDLEPLAEFLNAAV